MAKNQIRGYGGDRYIKLSKLIVLRVFNGWSSLFVCHSSVKLIKHHSCRPSLVEYFCITLLTQCSQFKVSNTHCQMKFQNQIMCFRVTFTRNWRIFFSDLNSKPFNLSPKKFSSWKKKKKKELEKIIKCFIEFLFQDINIFARVSALGNNSIHTQFHPENPILECQGLSPCTRDG